MDSADAQDRFTQAANTNDLRTIRDLLESGSIESIPKNAGAKALFIAEDKGDAHTVRLLLAAGVNPDVAAEGLHCALYMAVVHDRHEIMELLLDAGADPNGQPERAPLLSAVIGKAKAVEILMAAGARTDVVTEHGSNALHRASEFGQTEIIRLLLQAGIPVDSRDPHGNTALHYAARSIRIEDVLPTLLEAGADLEARSKDGSTPALHAAARGRVSGFEELIACGANPLASAKNGNAFAQAMYSIYNDKKSVMVLHILQRYPSLAPQGEELDKALVEAVRRGHTELVEKFVELGADVGQKPGGRTLLQTAPRESLDLKRLLRSLKTGSLIESAMRSSGAPSAPSAGVPIL